MTTISASPRVTRRPPRGRGPHGAGQHRHLAAGRRPHEPRSRSMRLSITSPSGRPTAAGSCFDSNRTGAVDLYQKLTSGAGAEELLVASDQTKVPNELVGGRPLPAVSQHRPADERRPLGGADGGRSQAIGVPEDPLPRALGRVLAGRPLGGLPVERIGAAGDLRPAVCPARRGGRGRAAAGGAVAGVHGGRHLSALAARRQGAVLPRTQRAR